MTPIEDKLKEIEELCEAATGGKWKASLKEKNEKPTSMVLARG